MFLCTTLPTFWVLKATALRNIFRVIGTRFRPLSLELPKPLFPIGGFPVVYHHIEACKKVSLYIIGSSRNVVVLIWIFIHTVFSERVYATSDGKSNELAMITIFELLNELICFGNYQRQMLKCYLINYFQNSLIYASEQTCFFFVFDVSLFNEIMIIVKEK